MTSDQMVFYFSGTGNSQYVANKIATMLEDELISINQLLQAGEKSAFAPQGPYVFVAPTYAWRLPRVVTQWIRQTSFQPGEAYFVLTRGGGCGNAAAYAKKLCSKKGFQYRGLASVLMPENYVAMFPTPSEAACKKIVEEAEPHIVALAETIKAGEAFPENSVSLTDKLESGPINPLFYALSQEKHRPYLWNR